LIVMLYSATSVDVEESLYKRAQALGIAVVTISQVCSNLMYMQIDACLVSETVSHLGGDLMWYV
jgi:hypothetical protein